MLAHASPTYKRSLILEFFYNFLFFFVEADHCSANVLNLCAMKHDHSK